MIPSTFAINEGGVGYVEEQQVVLYRKAYEKYFRGDFSYRPFSKLLPSSISSQPVPGLELIFITGAVKDFLDSENGTEQTQHRKQNQVRKRRKGETAPKPPQKEPYGKEHNDIGAEDRTDEAATDAFSESSADASEYAASDNSSSQIAIHHSETMPQEIENFRNVTASGEHELPSGNDAKRMTEHSTAQAYTARARKASLSIPDGRRNNDHEADAANATAVDPSHALSEPSGSSSSVTQTRAQSFATTATSSDPCSRQDTSGASRGVDEKIPEVLYGLDGLFDTDNAPVAVGGNPDDGWVEVKRARRKQPGNIKLERVENSRPSKIGSNEAEPATKGLGTKMLKTKGPETKIPETKMPKRKELGSERPEPEQLSDQVLSEEISGKSLRQDDTRNGEQPEQDPVTLLGKKQSERSSVHVTPPSPARATGESVSIYDAAPEREMVILDGSDDPQAIAARDPAAIRKSDATAQNVHFQDAPFTFGSDLQCRVCSQVITDSDPENSILCSGCGPRSITRYCSIRHLLDNVVDHWHSCGKVKLYTGKVKLCSGMDIPAGMNIPKVVPAAWERYRPAFHRPKSFDTVERFRQLAYRMYDFSCDYVLFNDQDDELGGNHERLATLRWESVDDRIKVLRLLNVCFFDPSQTWATGALYKVIRRYLEDKGLMTIHAFYQLQSQFEKEFNFRRPLTEWFVPPSRAWTTLEIEWKRVENRVIAMEKSCPMLRIWSPYYSCFPGRWWTKPPPDPVAPASDRHEGNEGNEGDESRIEVG